MLTLLSSSLDSRVPRNSTIALMRSVYCTWSILPSSATDRTRFSAIHSTTCRLSRSVIQRRSVVYFTAVNGKVPAGL